MNTLSSARQRASSPAPRRAGVFALLRPWLALPLLLALLWVGIGLQVREMARQAEAAAERDTANLARSVEQHMIRSIDSLDQALRFVQSAYRHDPAGFNLLEWTDAYFAGGGPTVQIAMIGPDGRLMASGLNGATVTTPVDLSDREHFRVHLGATEDRLFISRPVLGRVSQRQTIQFTRALRSRDGAFGGVIVISLDPELLSAPYDLLELGAGGLLLAGTDGIIRAWAPRGTQPQSQLIGQTLPAPMARAFAASAQGSILDDGQLDGVKRLLSFRQVDDHPLVVAVGVDFGSAFADFRGLRDRFVIAGLVLSLAVLLVGPFLLMQRARRIRSEHALRDTLRGMDQGVVMAGLDGRVLVANLRAAELLDLDPRLLDRGRRIKPILRLLGQADISHRRGHRQRVYLRTRSDGSRVETKAIRTEQGALLLTCTDVTEQQAAIAAQAAARAAAEAASRTKSEFLANMSHEIRTPMNGVIGMIQVLRHSGLNQHQRDMCEVITRSASSLLTVLNDILDYSKLEAGRLELEPKPARLEVLARDVSELMRHAAEAKSIGLWFQNWSALPPVMIDPTRMRQIMSNLLSNAIKFSDKGEIAVTLEAEPDPAAPDSRVLVRLCVEDQGIGMSEEEVSRLFVRFTQVDSSSTRRFGGTGLGLAITRDLVKMMGGHIEVSSRPGLGSEFVVHLSLPVSPAEPAAEREVVEESAPEGPVHHLNILVAEDDEVNRVVIRSLLAPGGHEVTFAENGSKAVHAAQGEPFDLILMDVMMPEMDGPTATRWIRENPGPNRETPIIALTANAMSGDRERYLGLGMTAYVSKPISRRELYATIETTLGFRAFPRNDAPVERVEPEAEVADDLGNAFDDLLAELKA